MGEKLEGLNTPLLTIYQCRIQPLKSMKFEIQLVQRKRIKFPKMTLFESFDTHTQV